MFTLTALDELDRRLDGMVQDDPENGIFRARRDMFTDEELFELEMKHIFEGNWIYLAHESQIPNNNDYFTTHMGRTPIVITRDKTGELHALVNSCSHRGAMLCRFKRQNKATFTCPFHGWTFANTGKLLKVKDPKGAGYPEQFDCDGSHDLTKVARFESYRGFLFGSLNKDVSSLSDYLGEAKTMIDMVADQSDEGLEVLRGSSTYTYDGNWKLQAENGADGYHVSAVHWNYVATTSHRGEEKEDKIKAVDASKWNKQKGGFYSFENGHLLLWTVWADPTNRPLAPRREELVEKYGQAKADWMIGYLRNLCLYPNLFLMDQFSSQLRVFRPISVDKTEVTIYCIAPKGEDQTARTLRIRQYEDFFNASGMATPDDTEEFRATQRGYAGARFAKWNDLTRGATQWITGPDEDAKAIGLNPILSGARTEDEGLFVVQHKQWVDRMTAAVAKERTEVEINPIAAE
ncbi:benzoate 1,2-dioxygenase large subunit [Pseudogemmobacter sp. W21_MBD1_M6]|uniref:benzoate 1,2-dioxygenase large subunit n=1 Tax=Pseudogemmobacter sp. W21_MBD1_M6 TaxID=3240271 RepID=UPI003F99480D